MAKLIVVEIKNGFLHDCFMKTISRLSGYAPSQNLYPVDSSESVVNGRIPFVDRLFASDKESSANVGSQPTFIEKELPHDFTDTLSNDLAKVKEMTVNFCYTSYR